MNSKWAKDLNITFLKTIKVLEETKCKVLKPWIGNDFLNMTPKAQAIKEGDKLDFIKIKKHLCFTDHNQVSEKTVWNCKKYLQVVYLTKILDPEYIMNS
jgi:hypothetical protein